MSDTQESIEDTHSPRRSPPSFFWPLVLVGTGIVLLLANLGYLPWQSWNVLWRLWPLLLVALGIDVLVGRRSTLGAVVSGLLILMLIGGAVAIALFARNIPALVELTRPVEWHTEHIEHPLEGVESGSVYIDWTSAPAYLSALPESSASLVEGDVAYRGQLIFDVDVHGSRADVKLDSHFSGPWFGPIDLGNRTGDRWDVKLSPEVPLDLVLDSGSGRCDLDLAGLQVSDLLLDSGSGSVNLTLPSESTFEARVDSGSGRIVITLPEGVGARVVLDSGSGSFRPDERFHLVEGELDDDGVWETEDFDTAEHTIVLRIDQGSGSISIVKR
jgi:hypothetical protein